MGSDDLRKRAVWQDYSGANAATAELDFFSVFKKAFENTEFRIRPKPKEFKNIYVNVDLSAQVLDEIYTPESPITRHGLSPDYAIDNIDSKKTIYIEVKRQDGWVEGGSRKDGRGNAHERSCKYFTPGLIAILREQGNIDDHALPFWTVFIGDITRDPCRVREVTCWYAEYEGHFLFWRNQRDPLPLLAHFETHIRSLLT